MCSFELASISDVMLLPLPLHSLSTLVNIGLDTYFNRFIRVSPTGVLCFGETSRTSKACGFGF